MDKLAGRIFVFLAACGMLVFPSAMRPATQATTQAEQMHALRQIEEEWLANEDNPDIVKSILADDFVHVLPMGFIGKEEHLDYLRKHWEASSAVARHFDAMRIRVYGNTGIVNGIVVAENKTEGPVRKTLFTDVFVLREGHWQAVNAQELPYFPPAQKSHP